MISLSTRAKEAIKTSLAMVIAIGIALYMNWPKPFWAGFAVAMISLSTAGQSLNKGVMRMLGTLVGAVVALIFVGLFAQERWWFMVFVSLYYGFCTYMLKSKKYQYFWFVSGFVALIICTTAAANQGNTFYAAVERIQETGTGILVYTLVSIFLWPQSSEGGLNDVSRRLFTTQGQLFRTYRGLMTGKGMGEETRPLRMQELQLLTQLGQALNAAESDSYEVWEVRHQWRRFHQQSTVLMEALERWRETFPEIQQLDLKQLLPNLEALYSEVDLRFGEIERMLAGEAPARSPQPVTLTIDKAEMRALSHFQRAAVAVTKTELERVEYLSRSLFDCVQGIRGFVQQPAKPLREKSPQGGPAVDPDRFVAAIQVMATLWIAFLIWVYVNPPGHETFVFFAPQMAFLAVMAQVRPALLLLPFALSSLYAGLMYIFVMPHLSGYTELGLLIFGTTFLFHYVFAEPRQTFAKMIGVVVFLVVIAPQNQQTYSFSAYANTVAMIMLAIALAVATSYIPTSPRPEKAFLRLLTRFFRHSEFLLSRLALDGNQRKGIAGRWKTALYRNELLELPEKLARWGQQIDHRTFPDNTSEQVQDMVTGLQTLAYRIKVLVDAREYPQAELLVRQLHDDLRPWRMKIESLFQCWAENPGVEPGLALQERLASRLATMEARIDETRSLAPQGKLTDQDFENFYRYLGGLRGLSEAVIGYARLASGLKWEQWREARF